MKVIVYSNIKDNKYQDYEVVDTNEYRARLDKDVDYRLEQESWIDMLAFNEALSYLKTKLKEEKDVVFITSLNEKKKYLLKELNQLQYLLDLKN